MVETKRCAINIDDMFAKTIHQFLCKYWIFQFFFCITIEWTDMLPNLDVENEQTPLLIHFNNKAGIKMKKWDYK